MKRPFFDDGCEVCRASWLSSYTIDEQIGADWFPIYRCRVCGTYWLQTQRWIVAVPEQKALRRLNGEPEPPQLPLPEFIEMPAHREWPMVDGRVILPDAPLTEAAGYDAVLLWNAEVLTAIADVLDADPGVERYLLRLLHHVDGHLHRDGYNLLVPGPLYWDVVSERLDPELPSDWGRDAGTGVAVAIGSLARSHSRRGPSEVETVGAGFAGRRKLRARRREFEAWRATHPEPRRE